jgi:peptidoglycan/xylan/chitin deacetylase (PgdA/CDA1 family)
VTTKPEVPETEEPTVPKKRVAFTFDDGPHSTITYQFVDKLKEYGASATFFVVGNRLGAKGGAAIAYAYENGCEIGIHSYTHEKELYYDRCTEAEYFSDMQKTADAINKYVPATVTLMRPPGGNITAERIESCPYSVITWNVDSLDWKYKARTDEETIEANINTIVNNVMSKIKDGDIVLMHEIYQNSYEAFSILIERLYADGYEIVSVSELLGDRLEPGVKYNHA